LQKHITHRPGEHMPKIAIDARMIHHTGIGRYIGEILRFIDSAACDLPGEIVILSSATFRGYDYLKQMTVHCHVFSAQEQWELPLALRRGNIQLLHSPQFNIPIFSKVRQIVTIHDCAYDRFPEEYPNRVAKGYYRFMFPIALRKSKRIIAISESTKRDLIELHKISPEKISVIYQGVDSRFYQDMSNEKNSMLKPLYVDGDFALFVGLTRPRKNVDRLVRAFAKVLPSLKTGAKLVLAGKIDTRFLDVRRLAERLNISDSVVQLGFVSENQLLALYKTACCFVFPSLYEGFGLPVLEAMAAGTPVITSRVSSLPEVAGDAALLVNPYDVDEIAEAMYKLFTDASFRDKLRQKGKERSKQFTWRKCAQKTLKVYEEVLHGT